MHVKNSNSVGQITGLLPWLRENYNFFKMRLAGLGEKDAEFQDLLMEIDEYVRWYAQFSGCDLKNARMLEVGYGARPNRLIAFSSLGYAIEGIDLDRPVLNGTPAEFLEIYRKNGAKRLLKSLVRNKLFDSHERSALERALLSRRSEMRIETHRFLVGDATTYNFGVNSIDFVYSVDVFEHIPEEALSRLCKNLRAAMSDGAIAFITPDVFTGIAGGHLVEWYAQTLDSNEARRTEPWEHLRKNRVQADCYLNKMRVDDYKEMFARYFDIVDVINRYPGTGRRFLTKAIRDELSKYSEDELLSSKWTFVLRKRRAMTRPAGNWLIG